MKCRACGYSPDNGTNEPKFKRLPVQLTEGVINSIYKTGYYWDEIDLYVCPNCGTVKMYLGSLE